MAEDTDQSVPVKCRECNRPMSTPLVCDYCHALNASAAVADHFTMLGLEPRFDLDDDDLHRRYVALSRHAHPDFHASETPEVQGLHLRVSAALNDAYRTLQDPASRAAYEVIREHVAFAEEDRPYCDDLNKLAEVVRSGGILRAVEEAIGPLQESGLTVSSERFPF